jgi:hypothetical protein
MDQVLMGAGLPLGLLSIRQATASERDGIYGNRT